MNWISILEKLPDDGQKVIVWQHNLSDAEFSRHHCAVYYHYKDNESYFDIYPRVFKTVYKSKNNFIDRDLEGDKVQLTHWLPLPEQPF